MSQQLTLSQAIRRRDELQAKLETLRQQRRTTLQELREVLTALSWLVVLTRRQPDNPLVQALEMRRVGLRWDLFATDNEIQLVEYDVALADLAVGDVLLRMMLMEHALLRGDVEAVIFGVRMSRGLMQHAFAGGMPGLVNIQYSPQPRYSIAEMTEAQIRKAIQAGDTAMLEELLCIFRDKGRR